MSKLTKNDLRWIAMILESDMRNCKSAIIKIPAESSLESHLLELRIDRCQQVRDKIQGILNLQSKRIEVG